jgi:hypothetical protein
VPHLHAQQICPHDNVCFRSGLAIARGQQREEVLVVQHLTRTLHHAQAEIKRERFRHAAAENA